MSKPTKKNPDRPEPVPHGHPDEEVVHVPKGASPLRFIVTVGLMLFVLVIFTVGDQLVGSFRNRGTDLPYMVWEHPAAGVQSYDYPDFLDLKRSLNDFYYVTTGRGLGSDLGSDEYIAYMAIASRMAQDAGIEVPDVEVARAVREGEPGLINGFLNREAYFARLQSYNVSPQTFEATLRQMMRVRRYEMLLAASLGQPEPADIEEAWKEGHQEYAFDLVGLQAEDLRAEAEAELPDDEQLRAWYEELAEGDRTRLFFEHFTPVRSAATVLAWPTGGEPPQALLERYPRPELPSAEDLAQTYYNRFKNSRFARPAEPVEDGTGEDGTGESAPQEGGDEPAEPEAAPTPQGPYPYDEVLDQALAEAPVHAALIDLIKDLNAQIAAGEEPDLAALAAELGLELESDGALRTRDEWIELDGDELAGTVAANQPSAFASFPVLSNARLAIVRVVERIPSAAPAFDDVIEPAREAWIDQRADELVGEKLEGLRAVLAAAAGGEDQPSEPPVEGEPEPPIVVDAETFARLAEEAGLTVQRQDWFDPARRAPDLEALPDAERFLRSSFFPGAEPFALEAGGVAGPLTSFTDQRQWLLRSEGKRDPAELDIRPGEYANMSQQALFGGLDEVLTELRSPERLSREYGLDFPARRVSEEGAAQGQGQGDEPDDTGGGEG